MDFGSHTLQIFVSLALVLACAGVALVCDVLQGNNEHLREIAVEFKVRHEEAERRYKVLEKKGKGIPDLSGTKPMLAANAQPAANIASRTHISLEAKHEPTGSAAPASQLHAIKSPDRQEGVGRRSREMTADIAAIAESASRIANREKPKVEMAPPEAAPARPGRKNWDQLLSKAVPQARPQASVIPFESIRESLPSGFQDSGMLQRAVDSGKSITGLIVSIGTNDLPGEKASEVADFVRSLLGPQDFGCQSGSHEFVLVCNGEQGAAAKNRLNAIAEKIWDFQLRSMSGASLQFSWGSIEAKGENLGNAVASAMEQMQETRSSRRVSVAQAV